MDIHVRFYDFLRNCTLFLTIHLPSMLGEMVYENECYFFRDTGKHLSVEEQLDPTYQLQDGDKIVYVNVQVFIQSLLYRLQFPSTIQQYSSIYIVSHMLHHAITCNDPRCTSKHCFLLRRILGHYQGCMSCDCWEYGVCHTLTQILNTFGPQKKKRKRDDNIFLGNFEQLEW